MSNDFLVRDINDDDLVTVSEWFARRKWPVPPSPAILPKTGYVAERNGEPVAVAWLYITNSSLGLVEWSATDPESGIVGLRGLKKVMDHIKKISEPRVKVLFQFVPNKKLAKYMEKRFGFRKSEDAALMVWARNLEKEERV